MIDWNSAIGNLAAPVLVALFFTSLIVSGKLIPAKLHDELKEERKKDLDRNERTIAVMERAVETINTSVAAVQAGVLTLNRAVEAIDTLAKRTPR
ncbi:MAG: hypothetical protein U0556_09810 [Dehalococcoidia bacterium]